MLAHGNSEVAACSFCLLNAQQREVPFARSKGMDPDVYDVPFSEAETYLDESARDVLGAYEGRVDVEDVSLEFGLADDGDTTRYTVALVDSGADLDDEFDEDDEGDED